MKVIILSIVVAFGFFACAGNQMEAKKDPKQKVQPQNIDKHNVGITKSENLDQTDPTLIEGNLEDNDFKN